MSNFNNMQRLGFASHVVSTLSFDSCQKLLSVSRMKCVRAGELIWGRQESQSEMIYVEDGRVRSHIFAKNLPQFGFTEWGRGSWLGEAFLLLQGDNIFHVHAVENSVLRVIERSGFELLMARDAALASDVAQLIASRYRRVLCWVEEAISKPISERIAMHLLRNSTPRSAGGAVFWGSQENLATCLMISRPTVNKMLKTWEREGLLQLRYGSIWIHSCEELLNAGLADTDY